MKISHEQIVNEIVHINNHKLVSVDYITLIAEKIANDVIEDIEACADENWNYDDLRLAVGRVLCDMLHIET